MCANKTAKWMAAIVALIGCIPIWAQGAKDEIKGVLSACGGDQAIALVRLDLTRIDVDAAFDLAQQCMSRGMDAGGPGRIKAAWQETTAGRRIAALRAAGARSLYLLWNVQDLPLFVMAAPVTDGTNEGALREAMNDLGSGQDCGLVSKAGMIVVGPKPSLKRIEETTTAPGPQWSQAIEKATDGAVQVFMGPSEDSLRVLEEMLPIISGQTIQVQGHAITRGLQWGAVSMDWPPRLALRAFVQSADHESAVGLSRLVAEGVDAAVRALGLKTPDPNQVAALVLLTPEVVGNTIRLDIDIAKADRLLNEGIVPALNEARRRALRRTCMINLKGMGMAIRLWANDHDDKMPPNLETLVKEAEFPEEGLRCSGEQIGGPDATYVYRGIDLGITSAWSPMTIILVHDRRGSHKGGRNVLFMDGHVEWATEGRFQELIAEDNRLRLKAKLPEKPAQ